MTMHRFTFASIVVVAATLLAPLALADNSGSRPTQEFVLDARYKLVLGLVRHTATYSPPVASRAFAYFGVTGYETAKRRAPEHADHRWPVERG